MANLTLFKQQIATPKGSFWGLFGMLLTSSNKSRMVIVCFHTNHPLTREFIYL